MVSGGLNDLEVEMKATGMAAISRIFDQIPGRGDVLGSFQTGMPASTCRTAVKGALATDRNRPGPC